MKQEITWYKPAEKELPKDVIFIVALNCGGTGVCKLHSYVDTSGIVCSPPLPVNVISWAELPKYKSTK